MVVKLQDYIRLPIGFCNTYLFLEIGDFKAPHRHGKIMVTPWLYLSIEIFYLANNVQ